MRSNPFGLATLALVLAAALVCRAGAQRPAAPRLPVSVLYVGERDTEHARSFTAFLRRHTQRVWAVDWADLDENWTRFADLIVVDRTATSSGTRPRLPPYSLLAKRPTVLIGLSGGAVADHCQLKFGRLQHGSPSIDLHTTPRRPDHPVFASFGAESATVRVLHESTGEPSLLFATPAFEEFPDAEAIGFSTDIYGRRRISIARHGSFYFWGFFGSPDRMTPDGRLLFRNVLYDAWRHRDAPVVVHRVAVPRTLLRNHVDRMHDRFGQLRVDYAVAFGLRYGVPPAAMANPSELRTWWYAVQGYLHWTEPGTPMAVDPDARRLGVPNNHLCALDIIAAVLRGNPDNRFAQRFLARYLPGAPAQEFDVWLARHRRRLFFSDVGGYQWFLRPLTNR